jgi:hypothetical protein
MRAEQRNAILKARFDARSRQRSPFLPNGKADRNMLAGMQQAESQLRAMFPLITSVLSGVRQRVAA